MDTPRIALVTGATGFVGSHLVRRLNEAGWKVHALVRREPGTAENYLDGIHRYDGTTESVQRCISLCSPDVTFHLASNFLATHTADQVQPLVQSNVLFGAQLLEALTQLATPRIINTGTSWQYYQSDHYRPVNLYAATKQAFEDILAYYVDARAVRAMTLNLFDSYGPGDTRKKLIWLLLDALRSERSLAMSGGEQIIDLVHIDDICRAYLHAADLLCESSSASATSFALSGGQRRTLRELVATIEQVAGKHLQIEWGARPYREREVMQPWDGCPLPGWSPCISLEAGISELLNL